MFYAIKKKLFSASSALRTRFTLYKKRILTFVDHRPLTSFLVLLGIVLLLIVVNKVVNMPPVAPVVKSAETKKVDIYRIGSAPKVTVQAQTKKTGVIQIVALTGGVVDRIYHTEGESVKKGTLLVGMSTNYQGGNALSLQRQLAQNQYNTTVETYPIQKEIIQKQRDIATKTDENSDALRDILSKSLSDTQSLIDLNQTIVTSLDTNIATLKQTPGNEALILSAQQLKSQYLSALSSGRASLRSGQYNSASDKQPAQLSDITRELTIKQLDVQAKQLDLNKEVSRLQSQIAYVNEGLMYPVAPFNSTIQRVLVKEKTVVTPGTPLMIISQAIEEDPISAVAFVPKNIASRISALEPSILHLGTMTYEVNPSFISTEAVEGTLYAVYYPIPDTLNQKVVSDGYITIDIPIGYFDTSAIVSFIPLDSVYQTRDQAYVFVIEGGKAKSRKVALGNVFGRFVEVESGLMNGDDIITSRTVIDGDLVAVR